MPSTGPEVAAVLDEKKWKVRDSTKRWMACYPKSELVRNAAADEPPPLASRSRAL
jgi:hypothetical protein